jgi:hypothetical protein
MIVEGFLRKISYTGQLLFLLTQAHRHEPTLDEASVKLRLNQSWLPQT